MDSVSSRVKVFDAFPKVDSQHTVRSQRGGLSTLVTFICGVLILWMEIGGFLGGYVDHQFSVSETIGNDLTINIDMLVAMPCNMIHVNAVDIAGDRYLAGETLNFEGLDFFVPPGFSINHENDRHFTPQLDVAMQESMKAHFMLEGMRVHEDLPACHIFGSVPVNAVRGELHITGRGYGYKDRQMAPLQSLNFTHVIQELSFGDFYPFLDNPLDATGKVTHDNLQTYKYFAKVVPTEYTKLGLVVDTNQYSLTEMHRKIDVGPNGVPNGLPGIFVRYTFEPIKLKITEKRMPFWQFLARLATIIGGLVVLAGYAFRMYEKLLAIVFGKRYVDRDNEKSNGLLDKRYKV